MHHRIRAAMAAFALTLASCDNRGDSPQIQNATPGEWLTYGLNYEEQRYSLLGQINKNTVGTLGLAWWAQLDTDRGQEATPLMHDGVLFTTTAWSKVAAFDAKTGAPLWFYDPQVPGQKGLNACCDVVNRGAALWDGKVYVGTIDGRLIALDEKSGKVVWSAQTTDPGKQATITGAPRAVKGKILIGQGGADLGARGYVSAYDAETGALSWRFYMTPNPDGGPDDAASDRIFKEKAAATWGDGAWKETGGGGTVWDSIVYDPKSNLVYVGVGNGSPWNYRLRSGGKGDNLFLASIVALKPDTGEYVWHYQTVPAEMWDYTATQPIMIADISLDGEKRRVVMQAPKNGFFYVLDALTGKLISAEKYVAADWAERIDLETGRPIERDGVRYDNGGSARLAPFILGGHNWQPMAFSPKEQLVYIPTMLASATYTDVDDFKYTPGAFNTGEGGMQTPPPFPAHTPPPAKPSGALLAWDPAAQTARWRVEFPEIWHSGVLATAGALVFHVHGHEFAVYDAANGKQLWRYDTIGAPIAPAITYELDGAQYVALMVGMGGAGDVAEGRRTPGRLLVFKLGATAQLPAYPENVPAPALELASAVASTGDAVRGDATYRTYCARCHVPGGLYFPDLSRSPTILDPAAFNNVVREGALEAKGMASFKTMLSADDVENIRAHVLKSAADPASAAPVTPDHPR